MKLGFTRIYAHMCRLLRRLTDEPTKIIWRLRLGLPDGLKAAFGLRVGASRDERYELATSSQRIGSRARTFTVAMEAFVLVRRQLGLASKIRGTCVCNLMYILSAELDLLGPAESGSFRDGCIEPMRCNTYG